MIKAKQTIDSKLVKSVNKNIRSSIRKLKPILKSIRYAKKINLSLWWSGSRSQCAGKI